MTADDDLSQRVQIAQQRIVDTVPSEAQAGERDSAPEPARTKVRFAERVEERTPEGTVTTIPQNPSSSFQQFQQQFQQQIQQFQQHFDYTCNIDAVHGTDMELEGLVMEAEFDRLQRCSDLSFLVQAKQKVMSQIARRETL